MRTRPSTSVMGPRPAVADCTCRICLPQLPGEPAFDALDANCVDTVLRSGWQVVAVGGGGTCSCCGGEAGDEETPALAYTVGLTHRTGHPELAMSGLSPALMHSALNYVAEQVVAGHRVRPGDVIEGALANAAMTVDEVSEAGRSEIGLRSSWFHRRRVDALQLVWPTTSGIFAWQPGAPAELDAMQPPTWRVPAARRGGLAVDPEWPFGARPDERAITCVHVREQGEPVRFVGRQAGVISSEDWSFTCGRLHTVDEMLTEHLAHAVRAAPSVREVADLGMDECAERRDAFSPWSRCNNHRQF